MIPINKINDSIQIILGGGRPPEGKALYPLIGALSAAQNSTFSVPTFSDLPNAATNKGRMVYVVSLGVYFISNGTSWTNDLSLSEPSLPEPDPLPSGTLYATGKGNSGQLGDGTVVSKSSPVSVVGGFTDWESVSCSGEHTVGIRSNGTLWSFGNNDSGQLGDGFSSYNYYSGYYSRSSPVSVLGGFTDWESVSCGGAHTVGLLSDGTLWSFGNNYYGQLGDGTLVSKSSPVSVVGGFTDWVSVSSSFGNTVGIRSNGTLWSFGYNYYGQLGDGTTENRSSPVSVIGGFMDWESVSFGGAHIVGIRSNGTLWSFGYNGDGELGDNSRSHKSSPVSVVGGFTDWSSVSCGSIHTVGLRDNGTLWSFGFNNFGQLGDGTVDSRSSPVSVVGGFTDWVSVSSGDNHIVGLRDNGTLWSFGLNYYGQLGDGTVDSRSSPVSVVGGFTDWANAFSGSTADSSFLLKNYTGY